MERDRRYEDRGRAVGTEPYRSSQYPPRSPPPRAPRGRSPPPTDTYAPSGGPRYGGRGPPRSRSPGYGRRRPRSPVRGRDGGNWRGRPRSPPRAWSPRRDQGRDGRGDEPYSRYGGRSPRIVRERSPLPLKRSRDVSPPDGPEPRSPPPAKRERYASPPRERYDRALSPPSRRPYVPAPDSRRSPPTGPRASWQPRSRSPPRYQDRVDPRTVDNWRRRSPSPGPRHVRSARRSDPSSGRDSANTSGPPSPPGHPGRTAAQRPGPQSSAAWNQSDQRGQSQTNLREPPPRRLRSPRYDGERSPSRRTYSPHLRSPDDGPVSGEYRSPSLHAPERDWSFGPGVVPSRADFQDDREPPPNGSDYRNSYVQSGLSPPAGPASSSAPVSAHNRGSNVSVLSAPTHPRGVNDRSYHSREYSREGPYSGGPGGSRRPPHSRYPPSSYDRGFASSPPAGTSGPGGIPTGPRSGHGAGGPPPFRGSHNNSSSTTYPRTQRFNNNLSSVPAIIPGGKQLPSTTSSKVAEKLAKLEEEQRKLEEQLSEKLARKRNGLREWENLERESSRDGLRSDLAEQQVNVMAGEGGLGSAAF